MGFCTYLYTSCIVVVFLQSITGVLLHSESRLCLLMENLYFNKTLVPDALTSVIVPEDIFHTTCCSVLTCPQSCAFTWKSLNMLLNTERTKNVLFLLVGQFKRIRQVATPVLFMWFWTHCSHWKNKTKGDCIDCMCLHKYPEIIKPRVVLDLASYSNLFKTARTKTNRL